MDDVSVFGWDHSLNQDGHEDLVHADTELLGGQEGSLIEFTCPNSLDGGPCLAKVVCWNTKFDQLLSQIAVVLVIFVELEPIDELFALVEHLVHLAHALHFADLLNQCIELGLNIRFEADGVLRHLERNTSTLRELDSRVELASEVLEIVGLRSRVPMTEVTHVEN